MPPINANITILETCRIKLSEVYMSEAVAEKVDNGFLNELNDVIGKIRNCTSNLKSRDTE